MPAKSEEIVRHICLEIPSGKEDAPIDKLQASDRDYISANDDQTERELKVVPGPSSVFRTDQRYERMVSDSSTQGSVSPEVSLSSETEKSVFKKNLTLLFSTIYAMFIITVGSTLAVADLVDSTIHLGDMFMIYLLIVGLVWLLLFHLELLRHCSVLKRIEKEGHSTTAWFMESSNYYFATGRHSGSFFLRIGAAGFCLGHLVLLLLILSEEVHHFTSDNAECANVLVLALYVLFPLYSFYELFIIFKYSNVIINRFKVISRFGLMHCFATSLCFWVYMILQETVHSLQHDLVHAHHIENATNHDLFVQMNLFLRPEDGLGTIHVWNGTIVDISRCSGGSKFSSVISELSPYLYPFSIEYNILLVGIWIIMWQNIGRISSFKSSSDTKDESENQQRGLTNSLILYADCQSANRGLFAGLLAFVGTIISVAYFFMCFTDDQLMEDGIVVNAASQTCLLVVMLIATLVAYRQTCGLDVDKHAVSLLDDLLLMLCVPCFFLYGVVTILPAVVYKNYINLILIVTQIIQVLVQTPFIIDGLRRCSNSVVSQRKKPGRELITFLIVCNIAVWIIETFEVKSQEADMDRILFYEYPQWIFLSHVTLPLTMFYRFHSSVCLVDIWKSAYEKGHSMSS